MGEAKNKYAFRAAAGADMNAGFSRFVPAAKQEDRNSDGVATAAGLEAAVRAGINATPEQQAAIAHAQSQSIVKSVAGSILNNASILNVAKMALIGMLAGATYGAAKETASRQGVLYELKYKTHAFNMDTLANMLFKKLEQYEYLQPASYRAAIRYCDQLFIIERRLGDKASRPSDADKPLAQACIDGCLGHIMLLRNKAENGDQRGHINIIKQQIAEVLADHRKRIWGLCGVLYL
jgi:hypothetical protein